MGYYHQGERDAAVAIGGILLVAVALMAICAIVALVVVA